MVKAVRWTYLIVIGLACVGPLLAQEATEEVAEAVMIEDIVPAEKIVEEEKQETPPEQPVETAVEDTATPSPSSEETRAEQTATTEEVSDEEKAEDASEPQEKEGQEVAEKPKDESSQETTTSEENQQVAQNEEEQPTDAPAEEEVEKPKWREPKSQAVLPATSPEPEVQQPQEKKAATNQAKNESDELVGIDTIDLDEPQGNWLYKRVWWERAEAKYEKIRATVNQVLEVRTSFFAKRAELDKNVLDPFYIKIGISQGELQEVLSELIARAEKMAEESTTKSIVEKAENDKKALEEIQKSVNAVVLKDEEVEKAILMLVEQISKIRNLEQQAWTDFKNIARVLDDKKARELFYKVDGAWRNIKELQQYITDRFTGSFDELIAKIKEQVQMVDVEAANLKNSGIDLKNRLLSMQSLKKVTEDVDDEDEEEAPRGIFTRFIIDPVKSIFSGVWSVIRWPFDKLFGAKEADEQDSDEDENDDNGDTSESNEDKDSEESVKKKQDEPTTKEKGSGQSAEESETVQAEEVVEESKPEPMADEKQAGQPQAVEADESLEYDFDVPENFELPEDLDLEELKNLSE